MTLRSEPANCWLNTCLAVAMCCGAGLGTARAQGQGFGGQISYTGNLGPVSSQRPLCLCVYSDPQLHAGIGCLIFHRSPVDYGIESLRPRDYYLIAFLDVHVNERLDADEPFEIYRDRAAAPADPVPGESGATDIDFIFGDENLPGAATPTPPATPSLTQTASPSPSPTAPALSSPTATASVTATGTVVPTISSTPTLAPGDCSGDGAVTIDELIRAVAIALATLDADACPPADINGNGAVTIEELIAAVNAALA